MLAGTVILKRKRLLSHLLLAIAATSLAGPVLAQEASTDDRPSLRELDAVKVTAQKREEGILEVPLAVSYVSGDKLLRENLVTLQDYAARIPGLSVSGNDTKQISIRGINAGGATAATVAITIDDVPFGMSSWAGNSTTPNIDPSELQQVEVLRGPQGTLYGAASLGGLIKYVTRAPDTENFSGRVEVGATQVNGGGNGYQGRFSINVPLLKDRLGLRLSAYTRDEAEFADRYNRVTGALVAEDVNSSKYEGFRAAAQFQATDNLVFKLSHLEQTRDTSGGDATRLKLSQTEFEPYYAYFGNDSAASLSTHEVKLSQLNAELDLGSVVLTSVSGMGKSRIDSNSDSTGTFGFVFSGIPSIGIAPVYPNAPADAQVRLNNATETKKFTQELRLSSNTDAPLQWIVGAFYTDEDSLIDQDMYAAQASGERIGPVVTFPLPSNFKETAVFGDVGYQFTDRFDIKFGARYSENKQTYQANQSVAPGAEALFGPSLVGVTTTSSDDAFTWQVSPRYRISDDLMVYGRLASGYRPGGPNSAVAPIDTFAPDTVVNAEVGLKGTFLDRRLVLDGSLYRIDWSDIQLGGVTPGSVSFFTNGGKARSQGVELDAVFQAGGGWQLTGNMSLSNPEITEDLPQLTQGSYLLGVTGDSLPFAAKFTANLGVEKGWELPRDGYLTAGLNMSHIGERDTAFRSSNAVPARRGKLVLPSYTALDGFVRVEGDNWGATLFARNLTNARGIVSASDSAGVSSTMTATFLQPRTFGVSVYYSF